MTPMRRGVTVRQRRALVALGIAATLAFLILAAAAAQQRLFDGEDQVRDFLQWARQPFLDGPMRQISFLGSGWVVIPLTLAMSILLWRRDRRLALLFLAVVGSATLLSSITKIAVSRPRPKGTDYGFPSGHVTTSVAFLGTLLYLAWASRMRARWRWVVTALCAGAAAGIACSRLYLNSHWVTDVVGGLLGGGACVLFGVAWAAGHVMTAPPVPDESPFEAGVSPAILAERSPARR
jgi:undecaprenyl-diphosphatase